MGSLNSTRVLYPVSLPDETPLADLDWATGVVRLFHPWESFERLIEILGSTGWDALSDDQRCAAEALTHEVTHLLQLSTTGFAYDFSFRLLGIVASALQDYSELRQVWQQRSRYTTQLVPLFDTLHRAGPDGVTSLSIMESAAFLAQKVTHYPGLGPRGYEAILAAEAPSGEYRLAYDIASEYLHADALDQFPHVANLALFTAEPETAFVPLLTSFRAEASRTDTEANHRLGVRLLNETFREILLGSAIDRIRAGDFHPVLGRIAREYVRLAKDGRVNPLHLMASNRVGSAELAEVLRGPMLFPPGPETDGVAPMVLPAGWTTAKTEDTPDLGADLIRLLCAASQLLQQDLPDIEPAPLNVPPHSPVASEMNVPVFVRMWRFSRADRTTETAEHVGRLLDEMASNPREVRGLRGMVALAFPAEEFAADESPFGDPRVQSFLRDLLTRVPYLLYYLSDAPAVAALVVCVAAFAPQAIVDDGGDDVRIARTTDSLTAIGTCLRAAVQFAKAQDESAAVVLGHVRGFDAQTQRALTELAMRE